MKKIIGVIKPFDMKQNFYVYEDGNKLDSASPTIDEISETIFALMQEYDVSQLDLVGPKQYNKGLSKKIKEAEMVKYDKNTLEINIV
jgi:hypothetical protein